MTEITETENTVGSMGSIANLPERPEDWHKLLSLKQSALDQAKAAYVSQKATVAEVDQKLLKFPGTKTEEQREEYDALSKRLIGERRSLAFAQANRAMADGDLKMCKAHMDALGIKKPRAASGTKIAVEDSPEVKAMKAKIMEIEAERTEVRARKTAEMDAQSKLYKEHRARVDSINEELDKVANRLLAANAELAEIDPATKAKLEARKNNAGKAGRKSAFTGKVIRITKGLKVNPYRETSPNREAFQRVFDSENRQMAYDDFAKAGGTSKQVKAMVASGNVSIQ